MARIDYGFGIGNYNTVNGKTVNPAGYDKYIVLYGPTQFDANAVKMIGNELLEMNCIAQKSGKSSEPIPDVSQTSTGIDLRSSDYWDDSAVAKVVLKHLADCIK